MSEPNEQSELTQFESALRTLQPASAKLDRDALMFRAGRASRQRNQWQIPAIAAAIGLLFGATAAGIVVRATVHPETRIEYVERKGKNPLPKPKKRPEKDKGQSQEKPPVIVVKSADPTLRQDMLATLGMKGYVGLRNQVIRWGTDAIPSSASSEKDASGSAPTLKQMYQDMAPSQSEKNESSWLGISGWGFAQGSPME